jgi:D-3-phosphoglycerate dehydrogenase / 2-oxoglutarate reductase
MHVLFIDTVHPFLSSSLANCGFSITEGYEFSKAQCAEFFKLREGGVVIRGKFSLDRLWLEAATGLKFIARFGSGMEHIDTNFAAKKGINCLSSPEGNRDALGDHATGMLLMLLNKLNSVNDDVRKGLWQREENRGTELNALTVGIIGYGNMGSVFAKRLSGFDCEVMVYDPYKKIESFPSPFFSQVGLETIFQRADVVSFHVPLNEETKGLCDEYFLNRFKKTIIILNTSRGPVVESKALLNAMDQGKVMGACLDVLDFEESNFEAVYSWREDKDWQRLIARKEVILSPHIAGWSHQSNEKMAKILLNKICDLKLI